MELAIRQRHQAGIFPIGDVDLVVFQHGFDGVTQKSCVVARQGRNDQNSRLFFDGVERNGIVRKTLEATKFAKWFVNFDSLMNGNIYLAHMNRANAKFGLDIVFA